MALSITTNVNSIVAQENLRVNGDFQSRTIQRLTSGYRINSAGDDAAGMAIANQFRSDTAELTQGVRNANDATSQLQIIDGGLSNIGKMLDRLKTLATQSASSTFTGNRSTLNNEYKSLLSEIDRQAANVGLSSGGTFNKSIEVYTGGGGTTQGNSKVSIDLSGGANVVTSAGLLLNTTDVAAAGTKLSGGTANAVLLNNAAGTFSSDATLTFHLNSGSGNTTVAVTYSGAGVTTGQGAVDKLNGQLSSYGITASIGSDGKLQLSSGSAFSVAATASAAGDTIVTGGAKSDTNTGLNALTTAVTVGTLTTADTEVTVVANDAGSVSLTLNAARTTNADVAASYINNAINSTLGVYAIVDSAGTLSLQSGGTFTATVITSSAGATVFGALGGKGVTAASTSDGSAALAALKSIAAAVGTMGLIQGRVGSGQNKVQYAINLAQSQISNFSASESRIRDADVAAEAANLTKAQVLQQASIAAMAQANSAPQAVLALLRG